MHRRRPFESISTPRIWLDESMSCYTVRFRYAAHCLVVSVDLELAQALFNHLGCHWDTNKSVVSQHNSLQCCLSGHLKKKKKKKGTLVQPVNCGRVYNATIHTYYDLSLHFFLRTGLASCSIISKLMLQYTYLSQRLRGWLCGSSSTLLSSGGACSAGQLIC